MRVATYYLPNGREIDIYYHRHLIIDDYYSAEDTFLHGEVKEYKSFPTYEQIVKDFFDTNEDGRTYPG